MLEWGGVRISSKSNWLGDIDADPLRDLGDPLGIAPLGMALLGIIAPLGGWEAEGGSDACSSWLAVGRVGDQRRSPTAARLGDRRRCSFMSGAGDSLRL